MLVLFGKSMKTPVRVHFEVNEITQLWWSAPLSMTSDRWSSEDDRNALVMTGRARLRVPLPLDGRLGCIESMRLLRCCSVFRGQSQQWWPTSSDSFSLSARFLGDSSSSFASGGFGNDSGWHVTKKWCIDIMIRLMKYTSAIPQQFHLFRILS